LTDEENDIVEKIFKPGQSGLVSQFKKVTVDFKDIYKLYPETWLNDEVVNFYFELLSDRAEREESLPSIHCFSSFFCSTLRDQGFAKIKRWTKRVKKKVNFDTSQSAHFFFFRLTFLQKTSYSSLSTTHIIGFLV
jgi:Ulp1 family protease